MQDNSNALPAAKKQASLKFLRKTGRLELALKGNDSVVCHYKTVAVFCSFRLTPYY